MENDILTAVKGVLQADASLRSAGLNARAVVIAENGEISPGLPMPGAAIASGIITTTPRDMTGGSDFVSFSLTVHIYTEDFSKAHKGPDQPSLDLKSLCVYVKTALNHNLLSLDIMSALVGAITFPSYAQRNYIDRWEGRVPMTYRWVHIN